MVIPDSYNFVLQKTHIMKYNSLTLLEALQADVRDLLLQATQLKQFPLNFLQQQPSPEKWSISQVLAHLNVYATHYITAMEQQLHLNKCNASTSFKPGWLGNYFTNIMKPAADGSIPKKMKSPKNAIPSRQPDALAMLDEFISHQHHLLNLLQIAKTANLQKIRVPTSLSKFISLQLGDTFRFFIAHQQRHFVQIHSTSHLLQPRNQLL